MSRETALGMIRAGNTGDEILQILNLIVEEYNQQSQEEVTEE